MACPDCFRGGKATGDPKGSITTLHGVETYIAGTPSTNTSPSTIIYFADAFGLSLVNNKLLADAYASATGFRVLVPNIIPGGPMSPDFMPIMDQVMAPVALTNVWGQVSRIFNFVRAMTYAVPFFYNAFPSYPSCRKACNEYARKVKAELPPGAKLGVAGFCWGGYHSLNLCALPAVEGGSERLVDAQFCAHPSGLKAPDDIVNAVIKFKSAVAVAHAKDDYALPTKKIEETEAILRQKAGRGDGENGFNYQIKIYEGVGHGFAVRAAPGNPKEADGADEAKAQAIAWFKKWL
jgi:dienelactone hydrolase